MNSEFDLKLEGKRMGHCVGGYGRAVKEGDCEIYSLRDHSGQPFVTVEMRDNYYINRLDIVQIKGKGNQVPVDKYRPFVMQWILNNGLYVRGDVSGCLVGSLFSDVLKQFEDMGKDGLDEIKEVDLGMLTPYKRSFIDSKFNQEILLEQTKNMDFLWSLIDNNSYVGDNAKTILSRNFNLTPEFQKKVLDLMFSDSRANMVWLRHDSLKNLASNPVLTPESQKTIFEKTKDRNVLFALALNPNLTEEYKSLRGLEETDDIPISPELQRALLENKIPNILERICFNCGVLPEIQDMIMSNPLHYVKEFHGLSISAGLLPKYQWQIYKGNDQTAKELLMRNVGLIPDIQRYELKNHVYCDAFYNLLDSPALLPELQLEAFNLCDSSNPSYDYRYVLLNIRFLSKNPNLIPELEDLRNWGHRDPNRGIGPELQSKILSFNSEPLNNKWNSHCLHVLILFSPCCLDTILV